MTAPNAYDYSNIYPDLGIDLNLLGTIMLDVKPIPGIADAINRTNCTPYTSLNAAEFWVNGAVGEKTAHLTLLHGLVEKNMTFARLVLKDWQPEPVQISHIEIFPFNGYACVVARSISSPNLLEAHARLSLLPHIDLFPDYKPHITLAYVTGDAPDVQAFADRMKYLVGSTLQPTRITYDS